MSRDSDKARELAEQRIVSIPRCEGGTGDGELSEEAQAYRRTHARFFVRREDFEALALAAMRYAYQEAARVADADKQMQTGVIVDYVHRFDGGASFAAAERIRKVLESRARDLGAE